MYIRYAAYALVALVMFVFTYLTCPIWAFVVALLKLDRLPYPLSLLHTHDDNVYGAKMRRSQYGETDAIPDTFGKRFTNACWWIWRNPNYGFNSEVLGLPVEGTRILQDIKEGTDTNYVRWTLFEHVEPNKKPTKYFGYALNKPYTKRRYVKLWLGWQWHPLDGSNKYMLKFAFNPFRTVQG